MKEEVAVSRELGICIAKHNYSVKPDLWEISAPEMQLYI